MVIQLFAEVPCNLYLSPIFPFLSDSLIDFYLKKAEESGANCCSAIFLKIRPTIWNQVRQFLQDNMLSLIGKYEDLYFKHGSKDLSGYSLPELTASLVVVDWLFSGRRQQSPSSGLAERSSALCFQSHCYNQPGLWMSPFGFGTKILVNQPTKRRRTDDRRATDETTTYDGRRWVTRRKKMVTLWNG